MRLRSVWQIVACGVAMALSGLITAVTLLILKATLGLQVSENTEDHGLDSKYHEEEAYHLGEPLVELHSESSSTTSPSHSGTSPTLVNSQDHLLKNNVQAQQSNSRPVVNTGTKQVAQPVESSQEQSEEQSSSQQQQSSSQQSSSNQSSEEASDSSDS